MKILSLNLHCFQEENRIEKLNKIISFIKENDIEICIFQEAAQEIKEPLIIDKIRQGNNAHYIALALNYNICFHPIKVGFFVLEEGLAFISKYPINNPKYKTISNTKDFKTWCKRDYLSVEINNIIFYNVHLGWDSPNENSFDQINNLLEETLKHNNLLFICGDFNHSDNTKQINHIKTKYYSVADLIGLNSYENPTFHNNLDNNDKTENKMIDFIFTNKKIPIKSFKIVFKEEQNYVSDHNGILIEI